MQHHVRAVTLTAFVLLVGTAISACAESPPAPPPPPSCSATEGAALEKRFDEPVENVGYSTDTPILAGGTSASFDGLTRLFVNHLPYVSEVTVEAWIKPTTLPHLAQIFDDYGSPGVGMAIFPAAGEFDSDTVVFAVSTTEHPGLGAAVTGDVVVGEWQHVAGTYDGTAVRLYVDGELVAETPSSGQIIPEPQNGIDSPYATIGANDNNVFGDGYVGLIDDLRVFHRALTVEELGVRDSSCV